ncbi:MAG TPA: hypothetical protein VJS47_09505 [Rhizomicrobium sp.]|nr:hypothetical protein [Rhizomicrobium sp.]
MLLDYSAVFPHLAKTGGYVRTSIKTDNYNCIAWAAGKDTEWWEPDPYGVLAWPAGAPREYTLAAYLAAFKTVGFKKCANPDAEDGFEKIAIFLKGGVPQHAARLLPSGKWTSKMGPDDDISHALDGLNGSIYGDHSVYMRRPIKKA